MTAEPIPMSTIVKLSKDHRTMIEKEFELWKLNALFANVEENGEPAEWEEIRFIRFQNVLIEFTINFDWLESRISTRIIVGAEKVHAKLDSYLEDARVDYHTSQTYYNIKVRV